MQVLKLCIWLTYVVWNSSSLPSTPCRVAMAKQRNVIGSYNITGSHLRNVGNHYVTNVEVHNGACFLLVVLLI